MLAIIDKIGLISALKQKFSLISGRREPPPGSDHAEPEDAKDGVDFCAASRRACRSALPIAGSSRSMMNLRMAFPSREAAMLSLSRCLRQPKSPRELGGVSPHGFARPVGSGTERHRIDDA